MFLLIWFDLMSTPLSVGIFRYCPIFFGYTLLSQQRVKLRTSNFACTFIGSVGTKQKHIKNFGKSSRGCSLWLPKIFRAPMLKAHRAVTFAIAQLSCWTTDHTSTLNTVIAFSLHCVSWHVHTFLHATTRRLSFHIGWVLYNVGLDTSIYTWSTKTGHYITGDNFIKD